MPKWRKNSIFGLGPRVVLDREQRAQFRARLHLNRKPGRLTIATAQIGRVLLDMLGPDGRLDPSHETIATKAAVAVVTVKRALNQLRDFGFLDWVRRLWRDGSFVEQTSNAYVLRIGEAHYERPVRVCTSKKEAREKSVAALFPASGRDLLAERRQYWEKRGGRA